MKLISEYGVNLHVDNKQIPKEAIRGSQRAYLIADDAELEKVWVATLFTDNIDYGEYKTKTASDCIAQKVFEHEPSQNEILMFMAKYDAVYMSYVTIDKAFRLNEEKII